MAIGRRNCVAAQEMLEGLTSSGVQRQEPEEPVMQSGVQVRL